MPHAAGATVAGFERQEHPILDIFQRCAAIKRERGMRTSRRALKGTGHIKPADLLTPKF